MLVITPCLCILCVFRLLHLPSYPRERLLLSFFHLSLSVSPDLSILINLSRMLVLPLIRSCLSRISLLVLVSVPRTEYGIPVNSLLCLLSLGHFSYRFSHTHTSQHLPVRSSHWPPPPACIHRCNCFRVIRTPIPIPSIPSIHPTIHVLASPLGSLSLSCDCQLRSVSPNSAFSVALRYAIQTKYAFSPALVKPRRLATLRALCDSVKRRCSALPPRRKKTSFSTRPYFPFCINDPSIIFDYSPVQLSMIPPLIPP
jgi:hypothetical protein